MRDSNDNLYTITEFSFDQWPASNEEVGILIVGRYSARAVFISLFSRKCISEAGGAQQKRERLVSTCCRRTATMNVTTRRIIDHMLDYMGPLVIVAVLL